jgi:riboflavin kinase/FMN adenylyltransferase
LHLLDFDKEIYGESVRVDFVRHLRPVLPFDSAQALIEQMRADVDLARRVVDEDPGFT